MSKRRRPYTPTPFERDWWYKSRYRHDADKPLPRWQQLLVWLVVLLFTVPMLAAIFNYLLTR